MISQANDWYIEFEKNGRRKRLPVLFFEFIRNEDTGVSFHAYIWHDTGGLIDGLSTLPGGWEFSRMYSTVEPQKRINYEAIKNWFMERKSVKDFDLQSWKFTAMKRKAAELLAQEEIEKLAYDEDPT
jgi:hypothetical protein